MVLLSISMKASCEITIAATTVRGLRTLIRGPWTLNTGVSSLSMLALLPLLNSLVTGLHDGRSAFIAHLRHVAHLVGVLVVWPWEHTSEMV
jgi:hypothetical protein